MGADRQKMEKTIPGKKNNGRKKMPGPEMSDACSGDSDYSPLKAEVLDKAVERNEEGR